MARGQRGKGWPRPGEKAAAAAAATTTTTTAVSHEATPTTATSTTITTAGQDTAKLAAGSSMGVSDGTRRGLEVKDWPGSAEGGAVAGRERGIMLGRVLSEAKVASGLILFLKGY